MRRGDDGGEHTDDGVRGTACHAWRGTGVLRVWWVHLLGPYRSSVDVAHIDRRVDDRGVIRKGGGGMGRGFGGERTCGARDARVCGDGDWAVPEDDEWGAGS